MAWYDWALWIGVLYMAIGSDFSLNWLTGVPFGIRINKHSKNPFNRLYYYIWAATDKSAGPIDPSLSPEADVNRRPLEPAMMGLCQLNMIVILLLEIFILVGMWTQGSYLIPCVFMFTMRAWLEILYASQLIFGKSNLSGWPLVNYCIIGLIPQTAIPFLLAMRYASGMNLNILWWQPWAFLGIPLFLTITIFITAKINQKHLLAYSKDTI